MSEFDFRGARDLVYDSALSANSKSVLIQVIEHMPNARPSVARIAARTSLCERQVRRELLKLQRLGILLVEKRDGTRSVYHLIDGWNTELPLTNSHPCQSVTPDTESPHPGLSVTPPRTNSPLTPDCESPEAGKKQKVKQEGKQRGTRVRATPPKRAPSAVFFLPEDWEPTAEQLAYATANRVELPALLEKFKADCTGGRKPSKNAAAVSFDGIFWTYLRNDVKWAAERAAKGFAPRKGMLVQQDVDPHCTTGGIDDIDSPPPARTNGKAQLRVVEARR